MKFFYCISISVNMEQTLLYLCGYNNIYFVGYFVFLPFEIF